MQDRDSQEQGGMEILQLSNMKEKNIKVMDVNKEYEG